MKRRPTLVIIPGIGDDLAVYKTFARRWQRFGYDTHIIPFGWAERSAPFAAKTRAFQERLDALKADELYLIGVSAGGTTAINTLTVRPEVKKVIAVCSPLDTMRHLRNPLLAESIAQTRRVLAAFSPDQKARILSVYALHDPVVSTRLSQPEGIKTLRIPMVVHPVAIFIALMFYTRHLDDFFKKAT